MTKLWNRQEIAEEKKSLNSRPMTLKKLCLGLDVIRALLVRCGFLVHMLFSIWAASCVTGRDELWIIAILAGLLVIEAVYSVSKRHGKEPKWFSPCIFVYLLAVIPAIWILNIDYFQCKVQMLVENSTTCSGLRGHSYVCSIIKVDGLIDRKPLVQNIQEIMLLILIVGKWLLPRGSISLDEHSQLLLIYFGLSFDILDLFNLFDEVQILKRPEMVYVVLVIFTLSLFQFTIVFTVVRRKRPKLNQNDEGHPCVEAVNKCCMSELWSLTSHILLHDGPYMVLRLHCLISFKITTYNLIFFTVKNVLIVTLEVYRYFALVLKCQEDIEDDRINASVNSFPRQLSESYKDLDQSYAGNGSVYGRNAADNSFGNPYKAEFNRSKHSLSNVGMNSHEMSFETNV